MNKKLLSVIQYTFRISCNPWMNKTILTQQEIRQIGKISKAILQKLE